MKKIYCDDCKTEITEENHSLESENQSYLIPVTVNEKVLSKLKLYFWEKPVDKDFCIHCIKAHVDNFLSDMIRKQKRENK